MPIDVAMQATIAGSGTITASLPLTARQTPAAVFTTQQAAAGQTAYQASCASCHLPDLRGRNEASPLAGPNFLNAWRGRTTRELVEFMAGSMPPGGATLPAET